MGQSMTASALQDISTVDLVLALVSRDAEDLVLAPLGVDIGQLVELARAADARSVARNSADG
jgi:hypothetical protein